MSFTVNLSGGGLLINRFNSSNMLKSTQEKLTVKLIWFLLPDKLIQKIFLLII